MAEYLWLSQIEPRHRIESIGIWRRYPAEVGRGVSLDIAELPDWRMQPLDLSTLDIWTRVTSVVISE